MASNAKSETSDSRYSIRELSSKGLQKLLRVSPKHQGHLHHEDPSLRHTLPENEEHKCDLETCEPPKPQNNPFLKVVNKDAAVEDAVEHMTTILDESENQFNEQRHPDCEKKINKVRAAFTDSYSAVEKISELSKLGIETAAVFAPMVSPASIVINAFTWILKTFKSVSEYFDRIIEFFQKSAKTFRYMQELGDKVLGPDSDYPLLLECVSDIFALVVEFCAAAPGEVQSRFKIWIKITFSKGGALDTHISQIDKEMEQFRTAIDIATLKDGHKTRNGMERIETMLIDWVKNQASPMVARSEAIAEQKATGDQGWSHPITSDDQKKAADSRKNSKDPAARQHADLLELQRIINSPNQSTFRDELKENWIPSKDNKPNAWYSKSNGIKLKWVTGPPGVGKSYHAYSAFRLLGDQQAHNRAVFFFRKGQEDFQTLNDALACMVHQIAAGNPDFCRKVLGELRASKDTQNEKTLWKLIFTCIRQPDGFGVNLIFDGIDEARAEDQRLLIELLELLPGICGGESQSAATRILITSRSFDSHRLSKLTLEHEILDSDRMRSWFEEYCTKQIDKMPRLRKFSRSIKKQISSRVAKQADGMLYVENILLKLDAKGFESAVLKDMDQMPENLNDLYQQMLDDSLRGLSEDQKGIFKALLTWLAFAFKPLSVQEAMEIAELAHNTETLFDVGNELFKRFSGFLEIRRIASSSDPEDSDIDEPGDTDLESLLSHNPTDYDKLPLQFQSRCSRDFFKTGDPKLSDIRVGRFSSHLLILDMSTNLLCLRERNLTLEAYAANYWFDHFLEMSAVAPDIKDISSEEVFRIVSNLATVLKNSGNVSRKFEAHAEEVYSRIRKGEGKDLPPIINKWINWAKDKSRSENGQTHSSMEACENSVETAAENINTSGSDQQEAIREDLRWFDDVASNKSAGFLFELACGHSRSWLSQTTPAAAAQIYRFAADAFRLMGQNDFEENDIPHPTKIAELLELKEDDGNLLMAVALVQESSQHYGDAAEKFERGLVNVYSLQDRFGCLMGLSRCFAWEGKYDPAIEKAKEALEEMSIPLDTYFERFTELAESTQKLVLRLQRFQRDAILQRAQCHSARNTPEDRKETIALISKAREMNRQPAMEGVVLNRLLEALSTSDGDNSRSFFEEFTSWLYRDQSSWLRWVFTKRDDTAFRRLVDAAAMNDENMKRIFKVLKQTLKPLRGTRQWCWGQFKMAMLCRSLCNDDDKAKQIIQRLTSGKDSRHSYDIFFDARLMLSDILYEKFRNPRAVESNPEQNFKSEMENIPRLDNTYRNSDLNNSLISINLARMYRICGDLKKYQEILESTFKSSLAGLRDDHAKNDVASLRLLAKTLSFFEGLEKDAQIAISLQFSYLDCKVQGQRYEHEIGLFGEGKKMEELSDAYIYCNCGKEFPHWGDSTATPLYICLICADTDLCEDCFQTRRNSSNDKRFNHWRYYCPQDHKYLKGPIDGWQGVQAGMIRIYGEKEQSLKDWLIGLEARWKEAWESFRLDETLVRDII